jgi:predicted metalloprotease with PDZ domain
MSHWVQGMRVLAIVLGSVVLVVAGEAKAPKAKDDKVVEKEKTVIVTPGGAQAKVLWLDSGDEGGAFLGVTLSEETEHSEGGARVTGVVDDSPAAKAGVREGDVIVGFDGDVVRGPVGLTERIHEREAGERVSLRLRRDGETLTVEAELGDRASGHGFGFWTPEPGEVYALPDGDSDRWLEWQEELNERLGKLGEELGHHELLAPLAALGRPRLGVQLVDVTPELRRHLGGSEDAGVLVSKVLVGTAAEHAGLLVGDLIVAVDGESVATPGDLVDVLSELDGKTFDIAIVRAGERKTISVTLPSREEESVPSGPRAFFAPHPPPPPPAPPAPPALPRIAAPPPPPPPPAPSVLLI